jgi:hypothetical protein
MENNEAQKMLENMFTAYKNSYGYKDAASMEIMLRRQEFEQNLDEMWKIYVSGNIKQVAEYKKQVQHIKAAGLVVKRSKTTGKHKIVYPGDK